MRWYKLFFSKYVFEQNFLYERQRCSLLLFHFSRILHFSFSSFFNIFLLSVFFVFSIFSAPLPLTKETMILAKYHSKMTLTQDCQIAVSISKETLTAAQASQPYLLRHVGQYPKHLGISNCTCNVLKASLLCL